MQSDEGTETDWVWDMDYLEPDVVGMGSNHPSMVPGSDVHVILRDCNIWICES